MTFNRSLSELQLTKQISQEEKEKLEKQLDATSIRYTPQQFVYVADYLVVHFNYIATFKTPYFRMSVKGGAHMCFVKATDIPACLSMCEAYFYQKYTNTTLQTMM